jgi:adenylate cyclase
MLAAFVALRSWDPAPLESFRLQVFDYYQLIKPRQPTSYPAMIVDIDDRSLSEIGQWPWPRDTIAKMVEQIAAQGAKAVAFDIIFAEPDRMSPSVIAKTLRLLAPETRIALAKLPTNDRVLAESFAKLPVVVGEVGAVAATGGEAARRANVASIATVGGDPGPLLVGFPAITHNVAELDEAAAGHGVFSIVRGRDGIIRRIPTVMTIGGDKLVPSLAMELLRVSQPNTTMLVKRNQAGVQGIAIGRRRVATDRNGQLWVHFSRQDPKRYVSAVDVINGTAAGRLKDKLVLVGTSAAGLFDLRATPVDRVTPGVEIHAQQLEAVLTGGLLTRPPYALGAEVAMAVGVGLIIITLGPLLGALPMLIFGCFVTAALAGVSWYLFDQEKILIDVVYPLLSSFLILLVLTYVNYFREESQRAQIRTAFSQYLSPELVAQLSADPDRLVLGGETRELSILFSDVRGFTSIAESYRDNPEALTTLMNRLLTPLSNAIIDRKGTIDKYMGDAVMAFWNAPLDDDDHACHAAEAALLMLTRISELNEKMEQEALAEGRPHLPLKLGIGISTGRAVVGNMGSDLRFDYSVLGDTVNLAARLEGLTAQLLVLNLTSEATARTIEGRFATVEADIVRVKGKQEPERVFTIVGDETVLSDAEFIDFKAQMAQILDAYRGGRFDEARSLISQLASPAAQFGMTGLLQVYSDRLAGLASNPPGDEWDGIFDAVSK